MLIHRIRPVAPALTAHVEHLWMARGYLPTTWRNMILPDGAIEVIFNLGKCQFFTIHRIASTGSIRRMRLIFSKFVLSIAASVMVLQSNAQTPAPSQAAHLAPIAFLTMHEWEAKLPDTPDGKSRKIHAQFTWTQNGQAIRISNQFLTDGKPSPYIDGLYAWDPEQRAIIFCYVGAEGSLTKGTVKSEGGTLIHEFQEIQTDGKTANYLARVTPNDNTSWENEIFDRSEKGLTSIVKVRYEATH